MTDIYKVDITLMDIKDEDYDDVIGNIIEYLENAGIEYQIGVGEIQ